MCCFIEVDVWNIQVPHSKEIKVMCIVEVDVQNFKLEILGKSMSGILRVKRKLSRHLKRKERQKAPTLNQKTRGGRY